ncbi:class I SAM-dependent methyltransferase [Helicobacter sp.]|uniref:class I SAM-dependent methyltransferase n=1 Tax=Helicobacter sp. TaxID=218 RepID=UPI00345BE70C
MRYIKREFCPITGESEFEILSDDEFPLFAGCVDPKEPNEDLVLNQQWVIYKSGVIALQKLIPLEILYKNGHDAGAVGAIWENHHKEFANFILKSSPKNVLEVGGGHGKLSKNCLEKADINWTIIEPNSTNKNNKVKYIDGYFEDYNMDEKFDCIVHSHLFEHIYEPNKFLKKCYSILSNNCAGGGAKCYLASQICENGLKINGRTA